MAKRGPKVKPRELVRSVRVQIRMTPEEAKRFSALGGAVWFRKILEQHRA